MNIVSSSFSTFHMVEQAQQLHRLGLLNKFITGIPKQYKSKHCLPTNKVISLWQCFAIGYFRNYINKYLNNELDSKLVRASHDSFSYLLSKVIPSNTDILIGISSYFYHAIVKAKSQGIITVVDHGSLHQSFEENQLLIESDKYGFFVSGNSKFNWLVEKQNKEFFISDYIFVLSELARKTLIDFGISKEKILVNNLGVSLSKFKKIEKEDDVFRILFCGNVSPLKGIHYLLKSFKELNLKNSELWLIGSLDVVENDYSFRKHISRYYSDNVIFKGALDSKTLSNYFSQCSVLVLPSLSDGFGKVVSEAMACGLPVIVTENTGASDIVQDGVNGFVVPVRSCEALSAKIEYIYENQVERKEMGANAYSSVKLHNTWNDYGDRLKNHLQKIYKQAI